MSGKLGWLVAAAFLAAFIWTRAPHEEAFGGAVRVIDGDSLHVGGTEVRLFGVDAFEGRQTCTRNGGTWACGEAAANQLRKLTAASETTCVKKDTDSYGRTVATSTSGTVDVAAALASAGLALAYRQFSDDYVDEEEEARAAKRGAWAGEFVAPWDARRRGATPAAREEEANEAVVESRCRDTGIKGNISRNSGERIFHVPGSRDYEATRIDESAGERWFCTESEAVAAGWRARRN